MIVVKIELFSAITGKEKDLGTVVIDNIAGTGSLADYRCRAYPKGAIGRVGGGWKLPANAKPHRIAYVYGHARLKEPVGNLVAKAFKELGYGS